MQTNTATPHAPQPAAAPRRPADVARASSPCDATKSRPLLGIAGVPPADGVRPAPRHALGEGRDDPRLQAGRPRYPGILSFGIFLGFGILGFGISNATFAKEPVDWVNPYIGATSQLLVPTFPTVSLPNSMLRVIPARAEYTTDQLKGISLVTTTHRGASAFNISPFAGGADGEKQLRPFAPLSWSSEEVTPYSYSVLLDDQLIRVSLAVASQSAIFSFAFPQEAQPYLVAAVDDGELTATETGFQGYQNLTPYRTPDTKVKIYIYAEFDRSPIKKGALNTPAAPAAANAKNAKVKKSGKNNATTPGNAASLGRNTPAASINPALTTVTGKNASLAFAFNSATTAAATTDAPSAAGAAAPTVNRKPETVNSDDGGSAAVHLRYGISYISVEQAKANLHREIKDFDLPALAARGRQTWNNTLSLIRATGTDDRALAVFYTALYRVFERPISLSESAADGSSNYFSAYDGKIHTDPDTTTPFYVDDWIWDTHRAAHPLRVLIAPALETNIINSYIRMAEQMATSTGHFWAPTFPEPTGDSRRMNSNHTAAIFADAWAKNLRTFDLAKAYESVKNAIEQKTLAPWSYAPAGELDAFYKTHGYFPARPMDAPETAPEVDAWEKRQPVPVTLGTSYDEWCLSRMAAYLNLPDDAARYARHGLNYENLYNPKTGFFHPKDADGNFITPLDYKTPGGPGGREFYDENNAWTFRWDVQQNIAGLIALMGGRAAFNAALDQLFREPMGSPKYQYFAQFPDSTGMHGQFSMGNEPSLHIPYLYAYSGEPWKTQKRIRVALREWFRDDLQGIPGDEDGGGMSAFVVFSMLGIYPVTPGLPMYVIGSPVFETATVTLPNGKTFEVVAHNYSPKNIYIQSATLNGRPLTKPWLTHDEITAGGKLELEMSDTPNKNWGAAEGDEPPSGYRNGSFHLPNPTSR